MPSIWIAPSAYHPSFGGVEELTEKMATQLGSRGWDVTVLVHRHPSGLPARETVRGVVVHRVDFAAPQLSPAGLGGFLRAMPRMRRELDLLPRPDLVHVVCPSVQTLPLAAWARLRRVPLVLTTQGEVVMDAGAIYQRSSYARFSLRSAARSAAALTACSSWARDQATAYAGRFRSAAVIPNGVDPAEFAATPLPSEPVVAAYGRHVPQKGFDLLLRAFAIVRQHRPAARLLIGGAGPESDRLRALAGGGVTFLGPLDKAGVRELLARTRTVVVPSRMEPFGIVALEALAAGRLLVYANTTGLGEAAGDCGWGVDPEDSDALADAIEVTLDLDATEKVEQAREHVQAFRWSILTAAYENVYRAAAQGTGVG